MESGKLPMQIMQKDPTKGCFYITCLLIFMQNILPIMCHIFLLFLNQFLLIVVFYCNFLTQ